MKYVAIFHANLNYAYLVPEKYEFVIRKSYELIIDTFRQKFPDTQYVFEASGYTIDQIAEKTPDVLEKLRDAIERGQCEFMGSPYAHPMLPNFPAADMEWSLQFAWDAYEKHLRISPVSFWNPECGWRNDVPRIVYDAGYRNCVGDFEAYSRSTAPDDTPVRPEIYEAEHTDEPAFYNFGFAYDLPGTERAIHFPFNKVQGMKENELRMFLRTDRVAQFGVRYFMGMEGYSLEKYMELITRYSAQPEEEEEGALVIFADDAEYVGTNGWFRLKYQNKPDNVFEETPASEEKLIALIEQCRTQGEFITYDAACQLQPLDEEMICDDDAAWHGARASTWAKTPMAQLLRPWQEKVRAELIKQKRLEKETKRRAWFCLTNSYNSDGQWPPTLPEAPHIIHPFNYRYCFENLSEAEMLVGGINRAELPGDPLKTMQKILGPQMKLVERKAAGMKEKGTQWEKQQAEAAIALIRRARDTSDLRKKKFNVLYPSEYTIRADALVRARRMVGGITIEKDVK